MIQRPAFRWAFLLSSTTLNPIALIGLPGAGKTTIGRALARRMGMKFTDLDHCIEERLGCSIRAYFEAEGEAAFRDLEQDLLWELTDGSTGVLSTGGGVVLREANRQRLHQTCCVVYLRATPEDLYQRLRHDQKRPLLQVANPLERLRSLHEERGPLYSETAHLTVDTGRGRLHNIVEALVARLQAGEGGQQA